MEKKKATVFASFFDSMVHPVFPAQANRGHQTTEVFL